MLLLDEEAFNCLREFVHSIINCDMFQLNPKLVQGPLNN